MRRHTPTATTPAPEPRRALVILAVLIVVVLLSLAAYQFADLMGSENKASHSFVRAAQARTLAESGVHYFAAALANPANITNLLSGNPFNNPGVFQDHIVQDGSDGMPKGMFRIIAPADPDSAGGSNSSFRYGVTCEAGKINVNTVMKLDPKGDTLYQMLMQLPNMTDDVANAIVDWIDPDDESRPNGAESDYYSGLTPSYKCKNAPLDSLEELLLVRGVTPKLLFGNDTNRNGIIDPEENDSDGSGLGWSAYLTVYSLELNIDSTGVPRLYLNASDTQTLYTNLSAAVSSDVASFILLARQYSPTTGKPASGTTVQDAGSIPQDALKLGSGTTSSGTSSGGTGSGASKGKTIASIYDLIDTYITVPPSNPMDKNAKPSYYASPLTSTGSNLSQLLPQLLDKTTTNDPSKDPYIWGRINVNTAPSAVLMALTAVGGSSGQAAGAAATPAGGTQTQTPATGPLASTDVTFIVATRPQLSSNAAPDPSFQTPAWLLIQAGLKPKALKALEKYITTSSQVYRVQSVGYYEGNGPSVRVEAIIDTNAGQPRILAWRNLSELGKGFNAQTGQ